nr:free fatty acid receptor 4-like [Onthophagus taurus]XP_022910590.1 free fatty acid receptor 4-like [Onthophagus taurus]
MGDNWNSSYVYGTDTISGWGNRYFFTYFTEMSERNPWRTSSEVTAFSLIFLISIFANVAIAICVIRFPDMRTVTNCFVLNLAAADLLFAVSIPAVAYSRFHETWKLGNIACRLIPYVQFVSGVVLLWTLAFISIDRHKCIVIPPYRSKMTPTEASIYSALIWLMGTVMFVPVLFWFREQETNGNKLICTLVFPKTESLDISFCFIVPVVLLACLLPMIILVYSYQRIFHKIISTRNTWANSCVMVNTIDSKKPRNNKGRRQSEISVSDIFTPWPRKLSLSQQEEIRINKHIKVVRVLFLNVIVVLLMWLPITIVMFLIFIDGRRPDENKEYFLRSHHFVITLIVAFLNTVINPVLYGVLSDNFRACLIKMLCFKGNHENGNILKENVTPSSGRNQGFIKNTRKQSLGNSISELPHEIA